MIENTEKKIAPGLYVTATPIGNLGDITLRALEVLGQADVIACEDTRVTGKLLARYDIKRPTVAYHDHNAERMLPRLLDHLAQGHKVVLVSDAGTPLISDPGYRLVHEARKAGYNVTSLPGASALLAALASAGLPTDRFLFAGFLPNKTAARQKILEEFRSLKATLVFYESPHRLLDCLKDMEQVLGERQVAVCRELTKLYEEVRQGPVDQLIAHYEQAPLPKGEIVLVVGPPTISEASDVDVDEALVQALRSLSVKEAVAAVTGATGRKRKEVYARALELAGRD
ncbi:16S rRNA (cytidine(1402)-2'-O)-methyltransferase [Emcibacter sp.]|uniref:16S rRNA (cytidine(1402)-2'-O)-methyltransferase n=1 Tax=Emcibacter sp. TaxID=1979954 RepID=UPI002AA8DEE0|nr:16S rRNA (cytidine(1402)-2'-O)-methyltransferase [Emcibacter sp.]